MCNVLPLSDQSNSRFYTQNDRFGSALSFAALCQTQRDQYLPVTGGAQDMRGQETQEFSRAKHGIEANDKRNSKRIVPMEESPARHCVTTCSGRGGARFGTSFTAHVFKRRHDPGR